MTSKLNFEIPKISANTITALGIASNAVIMKSMRTAIVPTRAYLKALVNIDTKKSRRSSGATYRAVTSKVSRGSINPDLFYSLIGVNRRTSEEHMLNDSKSRALYAIQFKYKKSRRNRRKPATIKSRLVRSRLKRVSLSRNDKARGSKSVRRVPNKYWHILERGFVTRNNGENMPYKFIMRTAESMQQDLKTRFLEELNKNLQIAIKQHFIKLIRNATP